MLDQTDQVVGSILTQWQQESLSVATPQTNPAKADDYVRPLITLAELLRRRGYATNAARVYETGVNAIRKECAGRKIRLHLGALMANLAITHLEAQRYDEAIGWLYAAAEEDKQTYGISDPRQSYALSSDGIFGQWLDIVLAEIPRSVLSFLSTNLPQPVDLSEVKNFCLWLAAAGDLRVVSSIIDYNRVQPHDDIHSSSVRLNVLRDLSGLFEVLWKRLGEAHEDNTCAAAHKKARTLAGLMCHMHYLDDPKKRTKNPSLRKNRAPGLLWNNICRSDGLVDLIDQHMPHCQQPLPTVWNWLSTSILSRDDKIDATVKRYLLAYRLRNETSHSHDPVDSFIRTHHESLFEWLLQANGLLYFWATQTKQVIPQT